jgi:mitochondrial import receptor subunit TOM40
VPNADIPGSTGRESAAASKPEESAVQFENFNKEWMNMSQQDNWDGFRMEVANQVNKWLQATHTLFLGTQMRECQYVYQFGPAFQSEDQRTVLMARAGLDGAVNGRVIKKVGSSFEVKASANSHLKDAVRNLHEVSVDYLGKDWTMAGKLTWQGVFLLGGAFSQKISPSLHLGGELTLVAVPGVTSIGQVQARWAEGGHVFNASLSRMPDPKQGKNTHETKLSYTRKVSERLNLGTEFKYVIPEKESGLQLAYEYLFSQARLQGLIDTDGKVSCCVTDFGGFGFNGVIDYYRGDYKFGVVMHVIPQPEAQPPAM